jgi:hypothetical protein
MPEKHRRDYRFFATSIDMQMNKTEILMKDFVQNLQPWEGFLLWRFSLNRILGLQVVLLNPL